MYTKMAILLHIKGRGIENLCIFHGHLIFHGTLYGHLVFCGNFGYIFSRFVFFTKKNLATLTYLGNLAIAL
jgi:hypothetical protein